MLFLEGGSGIARGGIGHDVIEVSGGIGRLLMVIRGMTIVINKDD